MNVTRKDLEISPGQQHHNNIVVKVEPESSVWLELEFVYGGGVVGGVTCFLGVLADGFLGRAVTNNSEVEFSKYSNFTL